MFNFVFVQHWCFPLILLINSKWSVISCDFNSCPCSLLKVLSSWVSSCFTLPAPHCDCLPRPDNFHLSVLKSLCSPLHCRFVRSPSSCNSLFLWLDLPHRAGCVCLYWRSPGSAFSKLCVFLNSLGPVSLPWCLWHTWWQFVWQIQPRCHNSDSWGRTPDRYSGYVGCASQCGPLGVRMGCKFSNPTLKEALTVIELERLFMSHFYDNFLHISTHGHHLTPSAAIFPLVNPHSVSWRHQHGFTLIWSEGLYVCMFSHQWADMTGTDVSSLKKTKIIVSRLSAAICAPGFHPNVAHSLTKFSKRKWGNDACSRSSSYLNISSSLRCAGWCQSSSLLALYQRVDMTFHCCKNIKHGGNLFFFYVLIRGILMILLIPRLRWCFQCTFMSSHFCLSTRFPPPPYMEVLLLYSFFYWRFNAAGTPTVWQRRAFNETRTAQTKPDRSSENEHSWQKSHRSMGKMYLEAKGTHGFPGI